ncbi:hypothetical protein K469DRAFT_709904 [Zopfia rhizophila CBS 207.26]|uniref:Uncharacterized protein n=1 Tax=Zopfia rhizophila CBS 207.26 TaxID=1314779 RepID=A0A6A6E0M7_9PEZI|nr:hypothetical protein K469DRAFT_709904 [Zopfia rhizophila CBS 207.26]
MTPTNWVESVIRISSLGGKPGNNWTVGTFWQLVASIVILCFTGFGWEGLGVWKKTVTPVHKPDGS